MPLGSLVLMCFCGKVFLTKLIPLFCPSALIFALLDIYTQIINQWCGASHYQGFFQLNAIFFFHLNGWWGVCFSLLFHRTFYTYFLRRLRQLERLASEASCFRLLFAFEHTSELYYFVVFYCSISLRIVLHFLWQSASNNLALGILVPRIVCCHYYPQ